MKNLSTYFEKREMNEIDVSQMQDLNYWCEEFNLQENELKEIVRTVGPLAHDVKLHLAKRILIDWPASNKSHFFKN